MVSLSLRFAQWVERNPTLSIIIFIVLLIGIIITFVVIIVLIFMLVKGRKEKAEMKAAEQRYIASITGNVSQETITDIKRALMTSNFDKVKKEWNKIKTKRTESATIKTKDDDGKPVDKKITSGDVDTVITEIDTFMNFKIDGKDDKEVKAAISKFAAQIKLLEQYTHELYMVNRGKWDTFKDNVNEFVKKVVAKIGSIIAFVPKKTFQFAKKTVRTIGERVKKRKPKNPKGVEKGKEGKEGKEGEELKEGELEKTLEGKKKIRRVAMAKKRSGHNMIKVY